MRDSATVRVLITLFGGTVGSALAILLVSACRRWAQREARDQTPDAVADPPNHEEALAAAKRGQKFTCPFCEEPAWRGVFQGSCVVAHRPRSCTPFATMDPEDFVISCALLSIAQARRNSRAVPVLH